MNIIKKSGSVLAMLCSVAFGMESPLQPSSVPTQTTIDLTRIAKNSGILNSLPQSATSVDKILEKMKAHKIDSEIIDALELGKDLLQTAIILENIAKEKGYTLWWRYTTGIEEDIATGKNKSFGRTLLAGFLKDGINNFHKGAGAFSTACTYIYWANAHYYRYQYLNDCMAFIHKTRSFIKRNNLSIDIAQLNHAETYITNLSENDKLDFSVIHSFQNNNRDFLRDLMTEINCHLDLNDKDKIEELQTLNMFRNRLLCYHFEDINKALDGTLVVLALRNVIEDRLLTQRHNSGVIKVEESVMGRGEYFHPRLTSLQLQAFYKDKRLIEVYSQGKYVDRERLIGNLRQQLDSLSA